MAPTHKALCAARALVVVLALALSACGRAPSSGLPAPRETPGSAAVVDAGLPPGHPEVPLGDPASNNTRVGRAPHRLSVDQLEASLLAATGFSWVAQRTVSDPDAPGGTRNDPRADMLQALAATLGRADYVNTTHESIDPAVTFSKLASDAARSACLQSVNADTMEPAAEARRIMRYVAPSDTLAANPAGVRRNMTYLVLRFWGRHVETADPEIDALVRLFERASTAPAGRDANNTMRAAGTPADGWRAVCIALATDPQFLTY